ncbi:MAG: hypothetical protein ACLRS8_14595 [Parabacteroides merdae]
MIRGKKLAFNAACHLCDCQPVGEDTADIAVRLSFGCDHELSCQRTFGIQRLRVAFMRGLMVFRCRKPAA